MAGGKNGEWKKEIMRHGKIEGWGRERRLWRLEMKDKQERNTILKASCEIMMMTHELSLLIEKNTAGTKQEEGDRERDRI